MMNLKIIGMSSLIKITLLICVYTSLYSQRTNNSPTIILYENDTMFCFNTVQTKQIAVWNESRKECQELLQLQYSESVLLNEKSDLQQKTINNLKEQIYKLQQNEKDRIELLNICEIEKKELKKEVKQQKKMKWLSLIGGVLFSVIALQI